MRRRIALLLMMALALTACGQQETETKVQTENFADIVPETSEPIILRDESAQTEAAQSEPTTEEETTEAETALQPLIEQGSVSYRVEETTYTEGVAQTSYPVLADMEDTALQESLNERIRQTALEGSTDEGLTAYEVSYEIATQGSSMLSIIFRGYVNYDGAAYPTNTVRTLNLDLATGENLRLTDYADLADIVTCLETDSGYEICSEGIDAADFSAFLNNGYVTDYAMLLLDYDIDFDNAALVPTGYSCIRDNHVVLFIETEHAMGDYVEVEFQQ